jgi:hypothetical protein
LCYNFKAMKPWIILAVLLVILPVSGQGKGSQATPDQQRPKPKPPGSQVAMLGLENANGQNGGAADQPKSYFSRLFSPENLPNIGLLVAGVGGIIVAVSTLKAIQRQAKANEDTLTEIKTAGEQTKQALELADIQAEQLFNMANTARQSLELSRDTAKRQLRAYIAVKNTKLFIHDDGAVEVALELHNSGQTPTYELEGASKCRFGGYPFASPGAPPTRGKKIA